MAQCEYCNRCDEDLSPEDLYLKIFDINKISKDELVEHTDNYFLTSDWTTYCSDCRVKHEEELEKNK